MLCTIHRKLDKYTFSYTFQCNTQTNTKETRNNTQYTVNYPVPYWVLRTAQHTDPLHSLTFAPAAPRTSLFCTAPAPNLQQSLRTSLWPFPEVQPVPDQQVPVQSGLSRWSLGQRSLSQRSPPWQVSEPGRWSDRPEPGAQWFSGSVCGAVNGHKLVTEGTATKEY